MGIPGTGDTIREKARALRARVDECRERGHYFYNQPVEELRGGSRVRIGGRERLMFSSYSYLGLIDHPRIKASAKAAIDKYGTGTHGVRLLLGASTSTASLRRPLPASSGPKRGRPGSWWWTPSAISSTCRERSSCAADTMLG